MGFTVGAIRAMLILKFLRLLVDKRVDPNKIGVFRLIAIPLIIPVLCLEFWILWKLLHIEDPNFTAFIYLYAWWPVIGIIICQGIRKWKSLRKTQQDRSM